jgi:hypothetical protein
MPTDTTISSNPQDTVDLDSAEAQKLLESAFKEASGLGTNDATAPVAETTTDTTTASASETQEQDKVDAAIAAATDQPPPADTPPAPADQKPVTYNGPEWAKDLPEDVRGKISELLINRSDYHKWRSDTGRQAALQAKLVEARREAESLKARLTQQHLQAAANEDQTKTIEQWSELLKADPNLAKAIESRLAYEREQVRAETRGHIDATVNPLYQHTEESYIEQQHAALAEQVPNYREVIASPVYKYWLDNVAPSGVKQMATTSTDVSDAVFVMRTYAGQAQDIYNYMVDSGAIQGPRISAPSSAPQPTNTQPTSNVADKVAQSRQEKAHSAPVVVTPTNPIGQSSGGQQLSSRVGDLIDLDNPAVMSVFADAYNKARHHTG